MTGKPPVLIVAIEIAEPKLADGLAALLADVPGLRLAAPGEPADAIARRLEISVHTVKSHITSLLDKLDAQGRAEAVAQAARLRALRL